MERDRGGSRSTDDSPRSGRRRWWSGRHECLSAVVDLVDFTSRSDQTDPYGDVVNTASRLQTGAPPGRLVVGAETYWATRSVIAYEPVEPILAKGKRKPLAAWLAVQALTLQRALRRPRRWSDATASWSSFAERGRA
jgi:adenylate/guanylate cyclase family protein